MSDEAGPSTLPGGDAKGDRPADPTSKPGGDSSGNVAGAKDHFGASGALPGGGSWKSTPDKDSVRSPNDDGHSLQLNFPDDHITGSRHGGGAPAPNRGAQGGERKGADNQQGHHQGAKNEGQGDGPARGDGAKSEGRAEAKGEGKASDGKADAAKSGEKPGQPGGKGGSEAGGKQGKDAAPGNDAKPFNPGGLSKVEHALDRFVNPNAAEHPILKGVMDNLAKRGEGLVNGLVQRAQDRGKILGELGKGHVRGAAAEGARQLGSEAIGIAKGFGHSVKTLGDALGNLAYYGTHSDEKGAKEKIGSALVDGVIEGANVIAAVDAAAGVAKGGAAAFGAKAAAEEAAEGAAAQAGKNGGAIENSAKGAAKAVEESAGGAAKAGENGSGGGPPEKGLGAAGDKPPPNNDVNDVADFEGREAAFTAGKGLKTGDSMAHSEGKALPPPTGAQLDKIAAKTPEGAALRRAYGSKQGTDASKALQDNVRTRSEGAAVRSQSNPNFGPASGRLVPEVGFKDGAIGHIDKAPGGSVAGSRTGDLGIAKQPVAPSEWPNLVGQKGGDALSGVKDLKVGGGYVKDKAGFRTESGGINPEELRPFTRGLKR